MKLGMQQYSLKEFEGGYGPAFDAVKAMGIDLIEPWCGAVPGDEKGKSSMEAMEKELADRGLGLTCGHITTGEYDERYGFWRDFLKKFGSETWVIPFAKADDLAGWLAMIPRFEAMAERLAGDGLKLAYHNHHMELVRYEGKFVMEHLLDRCPSLEAQFHIGQFLPERGAVLPDWIGKYEGRICSLHINDSDGAGNPCPLGRGVCRAEESVKTARDRGVDTFIVEINLTKATLDGVKGDVETLRGWLNN